MARFRFFNWLRCSLGFHDWEIQGVVIERQELIGYYGGKGKKSKVYDYKHKRECQICGETEYLERPNEYHPSKYVWHKPYPTEGK